MSYTIVNEAPKRVQNEVGAVQDAPQQVTQNPQATVPQNAVVEPAPKVKKRKMKTRLASLDHFMKYADKGGLTRAKCKYFPKDFACDSRHNGTSNLIKHAAVCSNSPSDVAARQPKLAFQSKATNALRQG